MRGARDARPRMNQGHEIRKIREGQGLSQRCLAKARQAKAWSWTLYRGGWKALVSAPVPPPGPTPAALPTPILPAAGTWTNGQGRDH